MRLNQILGLLALGTAAAGASAASYVLDFSGSICGVAGTSPCSDSNQIGQNYGDLPGMLDVSHRSYIAATGVTHEAYLKYWATGYSGLTDVAWGGVNATGSGSEISFIPAPGQIVTLASFEFGDYLNHNNGSSFKIYDGTGTVLRYDGGSFNPGATPSTFAPNISSSNGLVLRWGPDGYDVGLDNIHLSVTAVPEAGTLAMMLGGLGLLAGLRRRC